MEIAPKHRETAVDRMDVGILEPGRDRSPAKVDDARSRPDQALDDSIGPHRHDPAITNSEGGRPRACCVHRRDAAVTEDEVGGLVGRHQRSLAGRAVRPGRIPPGATA